MKVSKKFEVQIEKFRWNLIFLPTWSGGKSSELLTEVFLLSAELYSVTLLSGGLVIWRSILQQQQESNKESVLIEIW